MSKVFFWFGRWIFTDLSQYFSMPYLSNFNSYFATPFFFFISNQVKLIAFFSKDVVVPHFRYRPPMWIQ